MLLYKPFSFSAKTIQFGKFLITLPSYDDVSMGRKLKVILRNIMCMKIRKVSGKQPHLEK